MKSPPKPLKLHYIGQGLQHPVSGKLERNPRIVSALGLVPHRKLFFGRVFGKNFLSKVAIICLLKVRIVSKNPLLWNLHSDRDICGFVVQMCLIIPIFLRLSSIQMFSQIRSYHLPCVPKLICHHQTPLQPHSKTLNSDVSSRALQC